MIVKAGQKYCGAHMDEDPNTKKDLVKCEHCGTLLESKKGVND